MSSPLRIALISGATYDPLYERLAAFTEDTGTEVEVAFAGDHPSLNCYLGKDEAASCDLVSTHSKYAPSQRDLLAPLDDLSGDPFGDEALDDFAEVPLELARIDGCLYGLPRLVDVRLLHYRTDLIPEPPATWDELLDVARVVREEHGLYGFAFPGRESGLFGTFYELAEMGGAALFPPGLVPDLANEGGRWALALLRTLYAEGLAPAALPQWHFEEVHRAFAEGDVAMIGDWPAYYALHTDPATSRVADRFALCPYPEGPAGTSWAYGGAHTFALTKRGAGKPAAAHLLRFLVAPAQQRLEARRGAVPTRRSVMQCVRSEAEGAAAERLDMLQQVIEEHTLIPPKLACYPRVEDVIWKTVQRCIVGEQDLMVGLRHIEQRIAQTVQE